MSAQPTPQEEQEQLFPQENVDAAIAEEDAEEEDQVQILVCGTSNEGTISDFVREQQLRLLPPALSPHQQQYVSAVSAEDAAGAAAIAGSSAGSLLVRTAPPTVAAAGPVGTWDATAAADAAGAAAPAAAGFAATSTAEACIENVLDFDERYQAFSLAGAGGEPAPAEEAPARASALGEVDAAAAGLQQQQQQLTDSGSSGRDAAADAEDAPDLLAAAAARGKVVMDWEVTRDRRWVYARDQSQWFNYGFDEVTFKDWIQRQLDTRVERLAHRAVFVPSVESSELQLPYVETLPAAEENVPELRSTRADQANATLQYTPVQQLRRNRHQQHTKLTQSLPAHVGYPGDKA